MHGSTAVKAEKVGGSSAAAAAGSSAAVPSSASAAAPPSSFPAAQQQPKRPVSAFMHFSAGQSEKAGLGERWRTMSSSAKRPFQEQAKEDAKRYSKEMAAYKQKKRVAEAPLEAAHTHTMVAKKVKVEGGLQKVKVEGTTTQRYL